jgi:hexosaminidase
VRAGAWVVAGFVTALTLSTPPALASVDGPMLIPQPRRMRLTGGDCWAVKPPRQVVVASIPPEGYELSIRPDGIVIRHSDAAGAYYARMTLFHMGRYDAKKKCTVYPCLDITDAPAFRWRGVHLDDARHFLGKEVVTRTLEQMSWFKLNVFHWHLTDDQSWTLEIPGYPELVRYGAEWPTRNGQKPRPAGEKVGPFYYTANDVKEILAFARARQITVVPEIEFPGHFLCALCAYPEFCCYPEQIRRRGRQPLARGVLNEVMCVGNPEAIRFVERVLDTVCDLFPSSVIHIGGDECPRTNWTTCPKCQAFIKEKGLRGVAALQPWVTRHFVTYLAKKGRRAIGWDEIFVDSADQRGGGARLTSLLPKSTLGMCWRMEGAGAHAANAGYEIVRCPTSHCYFDYRQGLAEDPFTYLGGMLPLARVYAFDPLAGVSDAARANVIGGQCCNWTSHTWNRYDLEWKLWPRGFALAEILWTYPDPAARDFAAFAVRAGEYRRRLIRAHVNCAPLR